MPKDCYFEAHFNLVVTDETIGLLRQQSDGRYGFHLSRNAFKRISDTEYVMMATYRSYSGTFEAFKAECDAKKALLERDGYVVPKTITEFSIYDTNVDHDTAWIGEDS